MTNSRCIGIIGCGNMGFAIAHRLIQSGYTVLMGSRNPDIRHHDKFEITSITDCIIRSSIIFIAIHAEHYTNALISPLEHQSTLFDGKILVDISNQVDKRPDQDEISNAERLQTSIPNSFVVKAFNTISSYIMESIIGGESRSVPVASDYPAARDKIIMLAREMNFESYNSGSLRTARQLENYNHDVFPLWRKPFIISLIVVLIWTAYTIYMKFIDTKSTSWHQIFLHTTNKILCTSAISMLALVYMPSNLACIFQLAYGTKERRFPTWLDQWLLCRKQLGLLTFAIALCHALCTLVLISPAYYSSWFHATKASLSIEKNQTKITIQPALMNWKGELASFMGIITLLCISLLAITSIPSISNLMNWREWRFIQSRLGTFTLLCAIGHVFAMATPRWLEIGFPKFLSSIGFICVFVPVITILMRFLFLSPCFSRPILRIRRGGIPKQTV